MLLSVCTPKGGSGASVVTAACSLVLAGSVGARLADFAGDQPALLGLGADPPTGLTDWLAAGPEAPADALDRLAVDAAPGLVLLPTGGADVASASPEAGAALAVVLRDAPVTTIADLGTAAAPALQALLEVSDAAVIVMRGCYLALRRAVRHERFQRVVGAVVVDEPGRALGAHEVADVLGVPVLATFPLRASIARTVDAGVLTTRMPDLLARPARRLLDRLGVNGREGAVA